MAEGHIEFSLSAHACVCVCVCVCACVCVCVYVCVCVSVPDSCLTHNFIVQCGIQKLFDTNDHQDKTMCRV